MVSRAVFGVVYCPKGKPFLQERILVEYEHQGLFGALLPGGRLNQEENLQYQNADTRIRNEILVSALKREVKEELGTHAEVTPDISKMYMEEDSITAHDGLTLNGEIYVMRMKIIPENPLELMNLTETPISYLNSEQLKKETRLKLFGKILSDSLIRERLSL